MTEAQRKMLHESYAHSKPARDAIFDCGGRAMECTEDKAGIVWERFVLNGQSLILFATPHHWNVFSPVTDSALVVDTVAAIKALAKCERALAKGAA